jgi:hypothetical protein
MTTPSISIVMPLYNKEKEVVRSLASVFSQTISDFELIIVNDGSTDKGRGVVTACNDPRIRLIDQVNLGVSAARNSGICAARADLIAFLDADDEWCPEYLEKIMFLAVTFTGCKVFATGYLYHYQDGSNRPAIIRGLEDGFSDGVIGNYFSIAAQSDPPLCSSAIAVRKDAITAIGGFPMGIDVGEDLLTWARLAARFEIAYCRTPLAVIWAPLSLADRPPRLPQTPDFVATGLANLLSEAPSGHLAGLRQYMAMWHRMRAGVFLKFNMTAETRKEIKLSAEYAGMTSRLLILRLLCRFPGKLPAGIHQTLYRLLQKIRSF